MTDETHNDPLDGADVGETRTEEYSTELWLGDIPEFDDVFGGDRTAEHRLIDTEVVTDDVGDEMLRITVQSDITKRLPRDWDQKPHVPADETDGIGGFHTPRILRVLIGTGIGIGIAVAVAQRVLSEVGGQTVEFGAVRVPVFFEPIPLVVLVVLIVAALPHLPAMPRVGGRL